MRANFGLMLVLILVISACSHTEEKAAMTPPATASTAPWGAWPSPINAAMLAEGGIAMSDLRTHNGAVYWRESRPTEGGRQVLMRRTREGAIETLTPTDFNVRTRVHEYGGNAYLVLDTGVVFTHFADQRLYWQRFGGAPIALTPKGYQYADGVLDITRQRMLWVREDHTEATRRANGEERNEIVAIALPDAAAAEDAGTVLVSGSDFVAYPRINQRGDRLAWMAWDHPNMPWDRARLNEARLTPTGLTEVRTLIDDANIAVTEPLYGDDQLYVVADPKNWWNLQRVDGARLHPVAPIEREFAGPLWQLGGSSYVLTGAGEVLARTSKAARDELALINLQTGAYSALSLPYLAFGEVQMLNPGTAVAFAQSADATAVLIEIALASGAVKVLHQPTANSLNAEDVSAPVAIEFPTKPAADGAARTAHAWYYAPTNAGYRGPNDGSLPPLIVTIHGGPTSVSKPTLSLARQYWTSRGFALVDVNYGGSTSYGRSYRQRLNGQWGVVDVNDAIAAVDFLISAGKVDPARVAIRGGSAGGFTTLAALAFHDRFKAGANLFGVADIAALAATSHKFERNYDVSLIGPPSTELYRARSPLFHLDGFSEPLITLQGSEDKIVPPAQSRMIVEALNQRGVPNAYIEFAGEQHGFRQAANIIRAQEAELYFYGQIFGFVPADKIEPVTINHWPAK